MINISKNKCVGCGICVSKCPTNSVSIKNGIAVIDQGKCIDCGICIKNCPQNAVRRIKEKLVFAIGTDDGRTIKSDDHVGMSKYYLIWEYSAGDLIFKGKRKNIRYTEDESRVHGDPEKAKKVASVLKDVDVIAGKIFGLNISRIKNKFVCIVIREPKVEKALEIIKENINEIVEEKNKKDRRGVVLT